MRILILLFVVLFSSCAQIKTLDGGAKDVQPPVMVTSTLNNETLGFKGNSVTFSFDEYIVLNDVQGQLIFSPQLKSFPEVQVKGKELTISWKDTLLENTTYQFDFGNAVVDNTEGNPVEVSRVFSTGSMIDSLKIVGHVKDAWTQENSSGSLVQLVKELPVMGQAYQPMYQVKTRQDGTFQLNYLSSTPYYVVCFNDANGNARWDDKEAMDWTNKPIAPQSIPDSLDLMQAKSLIANNGFLDIHVDSCGWMSTFWDHRWAPARITCKDSIGFQSVYQDDSLFVVINPSEGEGYFTFMIADSSFEDSLNIPCFKEAFNNRNIVIPQGQRVLGGDSLRLSMPRAVTGWDAKKWKWLLEDSVISVKGNWHKEQLILTLASPIKGFAGEVQLQCLKGGVYASDWSFGKDTVNTAVEWLTSEQSGLLQIKSIPDDWRKHQFVLLNGKQKLSYTTHQLEKGVVLIPGKYHLQVWSDSNNNVVWDNHDYLKGHKAEKVIYRSKELNIRANWQEVLGLK
jgi:hypothetical protein